MGRERERNRDRETQRPSVPLDTTVRPDCACPKVKCKNHTLCGPCHAKHSRSRVYCERNTSR